MRVLVAYASRHGATQGIAERIAVTLHAAGIDADLRSTSSVKRVGEYDAFVIGSAAYMFHWLKDAVSLVQRNRVALVGKPVWLFSSGPLGTDPLDAKGRDQKVSAIPKDIPELREAVGPGITGSSSASTSGTGSPSGSPSGSSRTCPLHARASPKATSVTGPRSRRGRPGSPAISSPCLLTDG
jgi:menaquinone-dependent protoporphyrinogen oxidase